MSATARTDAVLLYFCYGAREIYDQAIYSILSLLHVCGGPPRDWRIVVYCDRPDAFGPLPVETVALDDAMLDAWLGGSNYIHRRKTCAIIDALERFGGRVVFIDSDTWFKRAPRRLLRRVGPGRACFHICEGFLRSTGTPVDDALARQLANNRYSLPSGEAIKVDARTRMWNTGVVGVDASDLPLVRDALTLSDAIWRDADPAGAYGKKIHHAEQFATGYALRHSRLGEAVDTVYHYWPAPAKAAFGALLPELVSSGLADRSPPNLARLYARRCRETGWPAVKDEAKMLTRRAALAFGLPLRGARRSV